MPAAKVLAAMHENWPPIRNARANTVGPFRLLRPHSPEPDAPFLELFGSGFLSAVMNRYSVTVAQQNDVRLLADDRIEPVHLFLCLAQHTGDGFSGNLQFVLRNDVGCRAVLRVHMIVDLTPSPRLSYLPGLGQQALPADNFIDAVAVRQFLARTVEVMLSCFGHGVPISHRHDLRGTASFHRGPALEAANLAAAS